ncbi:LysR family transcriptional regulator, partial [Burkholderia territorii]
DALARTNAPLADAPAEPTRRARRRQVTHCGASRRPHVARAARIHRVATKSR